MLYIIETIDKKAIKIGVAAKPDFRLRGFSTTYPLQVAATYPCSYRRACALERCFKSALTSYRIRAGWYALSAAAALHVLATSESMIPSELKPANKKQKKSWLDGYLSWRAKNVF